MSGLRTGQREVADKAEPATGKRPQNTRATGSKWFVCPRLPCNLRDESPPPCFHGRQLRNDVLADRSGPQRRPSPASRPRHLHPRAWAASRRQVGHHRSPVQAEGSCSHTSSPPVSSKQTRCCMASPGPALKGSLSDEPSDLLAGLRCRHSPDWAYVIGLCGCLNNRIALDSCNV